MLCSRCSSNKAVLTAGGNEFFFSVHLVKSNKRPLNGKATSMLLSEKIVIKAER